MEQQLTMLEMLENVIVNGMGIEEKVRFVIELYEISDQKILLASMGRSVDQFKDANDTKTVIEYMKMYGKKEDCDSPLENAIEKMLIYAVVFGALSNDDSDYNIIKKIYDTSNTISLKWLDKLLENDISPMALLNFFSRK